MLFHATGNSGRHIHNSLLLDNSTHLPRTSDALPDCKVDTNENYSQIDGQGRSYGAEVRDPLGAMNLENFSAMFVIVGTDETC